MCDLTHMWAIKQKAVKEQTQPTTLQMQTPERWLPEGKRGWGEDEEGEVGQIRGDRGLDFRW